MDESEFKLGEIIDKLLSVKVGERSALSEYEIRQLCAKSRDIFLSQPMLLELQAPIKICGNTNGQYLDLLRFFEYIGFPPEYDYLFLGNYIDRGEKSIEPICLLLAYKIKYPDNFFLLRGNHECTAINRIYGFYDECKKKYNVKLWKIFNDCFNCLPGGLSPELHSLDLINQLGRPIDVPDTGLLCDLLWSDPEIDLVNDWDDQNVSYTFSHNVVTTFLQKYDFKLICRSHQVYFNTQEYIYQTQSCIFKQVVDEGYEYFGNKELVTIFSAPDYCGEYNNKGAIMSVNEELICNFHIQNPIENKYKLLLRYLTDN